jgi:hypothetical protein
MPWPNHQAPTNTAALLLACLPAACLPFGLWGCIIIAFGRTRLTLHGHRYKSPAGRLDGSVWEAWEEMEGDEVLPNNPNSPLEQLEDNPVATKTSHHAGNPSILIMPLHDHVSA